MSSSAWTEPRSNPSIERTSLMSNVRGHLRHFASPRLLALVALLAGCAQTPSVTPYARVTSFGLFEMRAHPAMLGSVPNPYAGQSAFRLLEQTQRIPAELGRGFGYCFLVEGLTGTSVLITQEVEHPPWLKADNTYGTAYSVQDTLDVRDGRTNGCLGQVFDEPRSFSPGTWRVRLSVGGRTLAVQELFIVRSDVL